MKYGAKIAAIGAAAALLFTAGCSQGGDSAGDGTVINFLAPEYSSATVPYWNDLIERFEAEHPGVTVELETVAWADLDGKVRTLVATGEEPDILNGAPFSDFAEDGMLVPTKDALPAEVYEDMVPALLENAKYEGEAYGIPFIASARALFYNKELLAAAGVTEPPTTWAELQAAATAITEKTGKIGYGMPLGEPEAQAEFSLWAWNNGGDWKEGDEWVINSPENVEALEAMADMYHAGVTQESPWVSSRDDLFRMFGEGEIGILEGAAFLPAVLEAQGSTVDYGIAPTPTKEAGAESQTLAVQDYLMVFNTSENVEAAGDFLAFFYEADNYRAFLEAEGMLPVTQSGAESMKDNEVAAPFLELLSNARFYPSNDPLWADVSTETRAKIGNALRGESAQQTLDSIQRVAQ